MTIEEKAEAYDEAIKKASAAYGDEDRHLKATLERIFPELCESDGYNWIPKEIIKYLKEKGDFRSCWIAWLEKQGKQKPYGKRKKCSDCQFNYSGECKGSCQMKKDEQKLADKVEPKFKVKYAGSEYNVFETKNIAGIPFYGIEDEPNHIDYVQAENCEIINGGYGIKEGGFSIPTKPAMFSEQKSADKVEDEEYNGEDYGIDSLFHAQRILEKTLGKVDGYQSDDGILEHKCAISAVKKLYEQKPDEWSEEDENILNNLIDYVKVDDVLQYPAKQMENWLKSIKDRVQPKQEWSEEDERTYKSIIYSFVHNYPLTIQQQEFVKSLKPQNNITDEELAQAKKDAYNDALDKIEYHSGEPTFDDGWSAAIDYIRKKSPKPQNHWKPTEAQLASLTIACDRNDRVGFDLTQLLKELKNL